MKNFLRYMTPRQHLKSLDLNFMDERTCIEQVSQLKAQMLKDQMLAGSAQSRRRDLDDEDSRGQAQSHSPPHMKHNLLAKSTNLKHYTQKHSNGNIEELYSQTTRFVSGHNTPLTYMRKTREKHLSQINKE